MSSSTTTTTTAKNTAAAVMGEVSQQKLTPGESPAKLIYQYH